MAAAPEWLAANDGFRRRVLDLLATQARCASRDIPDSAEVSWASSGWTNDRNVTQMLELLASRGEVAVAGRRGRHRLWDLAERVYPADVAAVPAEEARTTRDEHWLRPSASPVHRWSGPPASRSRSRAPRALAGRPRASADGFEGRTALLSPFDRLIHDRVRALELFDFEYTLEMYKPAAKRRWGYFALPVLHHDRLVGKVDATADRKASCLRVNAVHADVTFTRDMTAAVEGELEALARWLALDEVVHG